MHVASLYIHPVKSLGGLPVAVSAIDRFGLRWDRRWMVVDEAGKFLTQRQLPAMALIRVSLDQGRVTLTAAQGEPMVFEVVDFVESPLIRVQVWRDQCEARLGSEAINVWLSRVLGRDCRLVFMDDHCRRPVDEHYAGPGHTVSFADGYPLLLTQQSSLDELNSHMSLNIGMERFRPNVVVTGGAPWAEDQWRVLRVGSMVFDVVKPCSRCAIPTINPVDASRQPEVFRTLKQYRARDGEVFFGQNMVPRSAGTIRVDDPVEVLA
ncbi:MAG: MOSC domain-containing protein [Ketobacter sp.]